MAARRNRAVRDENIVAYLAEYDGEDFIPSDDDVGDTAYVPDRSLSSSDEELDEERSEEPVIHQSRVDITRGEGRSRGRGQGRGRGRGTSNAPSVSGSTNEWISKDFTITEDMLFQPSYLPNFTDNFNKLELFQQYVDTPFIELVVTRTNQTFVALHGRSLNLTLKEFNIYIGATFVMAAIAYPWLRMYWEAKWRVPIIADNMSRNRFTLLRNSIKVVFDNDITNEMRSEDKLWKMRPLVNRIQKGCRLQEKEQRLSIDEMIIPFTGSCYKLFHEIE